MTNTIDTTVPAEILACRPGSDRRLGIDAIWANRDKSPNEVVAALQETVWGKKGKARHFLTWAMRPDQRSKYELPLIGMPKGRTRTRVRGQTRAFDEDDVYSRCCTSFSTRPGSKAPEDRSGVKPNQSMCPCPELREILSPAVARWGAIQSDAE